MRKLKAIWSIITCKTFWLVFRDSKNNLYRLNSGFHPIDIPTVAQDMIDVLNDELDANKAVDEVNEIINRLK